MNVAADLKDCSMVINRMLVNPVLLQTVESAADACVDRLRRGGKLLLAGNGASAGDAQHLTCNLVSRFAFDRPGAAAICLSTDTSLLTAIGNDYGFETLFARQVDALGTANDAFIGLSTSGRSPNILAAFETAKRRGLLCIALVGEGGARLANTVDFAIVIPSGDSPRIQEAHILLGHAMCRRIEASIYSA